MNTDEIFVNRRAISKKICKAIHDNGVQLCSLTEFYNAKDILDKDSFTSENQELETIINFFQSRGLLKRRSNIISFHNCISAVKKFAEDNGADALTSLLTVQT